MMSGISGVQRADGLGKDVWNASMQTQAKQREEKQQSSVHQASPEAKPKIDVTKLTEDDKKQLEERLKKVNDSLASFGKVLKFKYDDEAQIMYVEVIDAESQEVIASLPPEFLIELSIKMKELVGLFLDKRL